MPNPQQPTGKQTTLGCFILAALAAGIAGIAVYVFSGDDTSDPTEDDAMVMCEEFVKKRIKSPGSAAFSGVTETDRTTLNDTQPWKFKIEGHVDSDNSFGASKRNTYTCTVSTKDGDQWTLDDMQMTER